MKLLLVILTLFISVSYANIHLSLEDALIHTLKNDFNLKLAKVETQISKTSIKKEDAKFEPTIAINALRSSDKSSPTTDIETDNYSANLKNRFSTGTTATLSYSHDETLYNTSSDNFNSATSLKLEQEILRGLGRGYNLTNLHVAKKRYALSTQDFKKQNIQTIYNLQLAYWSYLKAYEELRIRRESMELSLRLLEQKRKEVEFGGYAKINLLEIEADVLSKRRQISATEQAFNSSKIELLRTMNAPLAWYSQKIIPTQKADISSNNYTEDSLMQQALNNRQDYIKAELNIDISDILKEYNRERLKPALTLSGTITNNSPTLIKDDYNALDTFSRKGWLVALNFSYELFNNSAKAEHEKASLSLQKTKTKLAQLTNDIHAQILDAKNSLDFSKKIANLTIAEYAQQQKVLAAEKLKLQSGMSNIRDYLFNQNALILSELNLIGNKIAFVKAEASLYKTVGIVPPRFINILGEENAK